MTATLFESTIADCLDTLCDALAAMSLPEQVDALNHIRRRLHAAGPFREEPVDNVQWVKSASVQANDYNPNTVATPEYKALGRSIRKFGYGMPVVTVEADTGDITVDGFHRGRIGKEDIVVRRRTHGYLPVARIKANAAGRNDRIQATILFNRARGEHAVQPMTEIVAEMKTNGWAEDEIAEALGMDADEVLRFLNNAGLPALFKNHVYSRAWE